MLILDMPATEDSNWEAWREKSPGTPREVRIYRSPRTQSEAVVWEPRCYSYFPGLLTRLDIAAVPCGPQHLVWCTAHDSNLWLFWLSNPPPPIRKWFCWFERSSASKNPLQQRHLISGLGRLGNWMQKLGVNVFFRGRHLENLTYSAQGLRRQRNLRIWRKWSMCHWKNHPKAPFYIE